MPWSLKKELQIKKKLLKYEECVFDTPKLEKVYHISILSISITIIQCLGFLNDGELSFPFWRILPQV